jgi:hypothetical protein
MSTNARTQQATSGKRTPKGDGMTNVMNRRGRGALRWLSLGPAILAVACGGGGDADKPAEASGPFESMTVSANDSSQVVATQAGVPLGEDTVAFLARDALTFEHGVFLAQAGVITPLHVGDLVSPFDIDVLEQNLLVADSAWGPEGAGALLSIAADSGELTPLLEGYRPVSVTVGRRGAHAEGVYFSGKSPESGAPGVFRLAGDSVEVVYEGEPLVEPSGIALLDDGRVIVGETSLDGGTEAALVMLDGGTASVVARELRSGYPFGIALTPDQSSVIVSAVDRDTWNDGVYTVPVAGGAVLQVAEFEEQMSSAGLKEAERAGTYAWASSSQNGGTVYTVVAK